MSLLENFGIPVSSDVACMVKSKSVKYRIIVLSLMSWCGFLSARLPGQAVGPQFCGDEGTVYPEGDLNLDCYVNIQDFALFSGNWLQCSDPQNLECDILSAASLRDENAVQSVYLNGVPHTNTHGVFRLTYDAADSFFPIMMWDAPASSGDWTWSNLAAAGFNTVVPGRVQWPLQLASWGQAANLQVVLMTAYADSRLSAVSGHPNILGNVWMEDPLASYDQTDMAQLYDNFAAYRTNARTLVPNMLVFVSENVLTRESLRSWWTMWNTVGDVSCHKNFSIGSICDSISPEPMGISQSTTLAVVVNAEAKPVWLIAAAHESVSNSAGAPRFPTPQQLRCEVYAGLIQGATGIAYYGWDSSRTRADGVIGMAANPQATYQTGQISATPLQLAQSRALWQAVGYINQEIAELKGALLSPTVSVNEVNYEVQISGAAHSPVPIRTLLKPWPAGGYVLLTANVDNAVPKLDTNNWICPEPLQVTYSWPRTLQTIQPLFENRAALTPDSEGRSFTDTYDPFDVHVYQIVFAD